MWAGQLSLVRGTKNTHTAGCPERTWMLSQPSQDEAQMTHSFHRCSLKGSIHTETQDLCPDDSFSLVFPPWFLMRVWRSPVASSNFYNSNLAIIKIEDREVSCTQAVLIKSLSSVQYVIYTSQQLFRSTALLLGLDSLDNVLPKVGRLCVCAHAWVMLHLHSLRMHECVCVSALALACFSQ